MSPSVKKNGATIARASKMVAVISSGLSMNIRERRFKTNDTDRILRRQEKRRKRNYPSSNS